MEEFTRESALRLETGVSAVRTIALKLASFSPAHQHLGEVELEPQGLTSCMDYAVFFFTQANDWSGQRTVSRAG